MRLFLKLNPQWLRSNALEPYRYRWESWLCCFLLPLWLIHVAVQEKPTQQSNYLQLKINLKGNNKNRLTHIENRLVVAKRDGGEEDWEFGISRCKQLHIRWINSEVLLRSTGNCTQYPVISHMEKNMKMNNYIHN